MKIFRKALRYWIAVTSVLTFLGGWAILAHSPKPVQTVTIQSAALPTLPPIKVYGSTNNGLTFFPNNVQTNTSVTQQQSTGMPLLRTRGS